MWRRAWSAREEHDEENLDVAGSSSCRRRNDDSRVGAGIAARADAGAHGTSGSANGGEGSESCSKRYGKKSGSKDAVGSGARVGASFRALGVLDGHGGLGRRWNGRGYAVSLR